MASANKLSLERHSQPNPWKLSIQYAIFRRIYALVFLFFYPPARNLPINKAHQNVTLAGNYAPSLAMWLYASDCALLALLNARMYFERIRDHLFHFLILTSVFRNPLGLQLALFRE